MRYDPAKHHRRSIRLKGYDYSQAGFYFVTICCYQRQCLFGDIVNGVMQLNQYGEIVEKEWLQSPLIRKSPGTPIWQRNYYEHIIRSEESLNKIREYVVNNPLLWERDQLHPNNPSKW